MPVQNDLLTPTLKPKRNVLQKRYQASINGMYAKLKSQAQAQGAH